ncbi:MAG: MerR family transcriptional regulator [Candidatus Kapabacteria bacterium]|nr:MerR family transcriptional regulator [Candidatus Kapabacteria bacterium]
MKYSIEMASKLSGLTPILIRAWENRYNILKPERTEGNHRLYSEEDITRLCLLSEVRNFGFRISDIVNLTDSELRTLIVKKTDFDEEHSQEHISNSSHNTLVVDLLNLVEKYDEQSIKTLISELRINYSKPMIINNIILPLMREVGAKWKSGEMRISHEHFISAIISNYLTNMRENNKKYQLSRKVVVCTLSGQYHEIGALAASVLISEGGYKVIYLGANSPTEEIAASFLKSGADAIVISIIIPEIDSFLLTEFQRLREYINKAPILVGGNLNDSFGEKLNLLGVNYITDINAIVPQLEKAFLKT